MAKKAELRAVLSLNNSPFLRSAAAALATGRAVARQLNQTPFKFLGTAAFIGLEKGIRGAASGLKSMASFGVGAAAAGLRSVAIAAPLAAAGMAAGVAHAYNFGSELQDMSDRTGIGVKNLVVLQTALKDAGIEFGALLPAIGKLDSALVKEVADGGGGIFASLGLDAKALKEADPGEAFEQVMTRIARIQNDAERADAAKKIFGRGGMSLLSLARDPNAMANARQAVGSQADILGEKSGTFDRISDIIGHLQIKMRGFFVGVANGLSGALLPVLEKFDAMDFAGLGQKFSAFVKDGAAFLIFSFEAVRDIWDSLAKSPAIAAFEAIASGFQTVFRWVVNAIANAAIIVANMVTAVEKVWALMNPGESQPDFVPRGAAGGPEFDAATGKMKGGTRGGKDTGSFLSLVGLNEPLKGFGGGGDAVKRGRSFAEIRAGMDDGTEGPRGPFKPTPVLPPWRLQGFSHALGSPFAAHLIGASMAGGLSRYQGFQTGDADKSMRTLGLTDGSVTPLMRHAEMRQIRNARKAAGDTTIMDVAAGDAKRRKEHLRNEERKRLAQGSDNQLLSSIVKNSATTAKVLKTTFNVQEGETEG